jgi:TonB family protein
VCGKELMKILNSRAMLAMAAYCAAALCGSAGASAQCSVPHFRKGQDYGASVFVSIALRDFTVSQLTCLAQRLRSRRRELKTFGVFFFGSYEAAKHFQPTAEGYPARWPQWAAQLHAIYTFDAANHSELLNIIPQGYKSDPSLSTTIAVPIVTTPRCRLQIQDRCLMALSEDIIYPEEAIRAKVWGSVALKGNITSAGTVTAVQVIEAHVERDQGTALLTDAACRNLRAWKFDSGQRDTSFRITYSYVFEAAPSAGGAPKVEWSLPNQIIIHEHSAN